MKNEIKIKLDHALILCNQQKFVEASLLYLELLSLIPENTDVLTNLGTIELQLGNYQKGIELIQKSLKINSNQVHAISNLANAFLEQGEIKAAISEYELALKINDQNSNLFYNYARALKADGKVEDAKKNFTNAILLNPYHDLAYNNRGIIFMLQGHFDQALTDFNYAIQINPKLNEAYLNRANIYFDKKSYPLAINDYDHIIKNKFENDEAYLKKGLSLFALEEYSSAIESLELHLIKEPICQKSLLSIGSCHQKLKRYNEALYYYEKLLSINPASYECLSNIGFIYFDLKKYDDAIKTFEHAVLLNPNKSNAYFGIARIHIEHEEFNEAINIYKKLMEHNQNSVDAEFYLSMIYLYLKNFKKGWNLYEKRLISNKYTGDFIPLRNLEHNKCLDFTNKKILIYNEQGIGDQILFMSVISELDTENNSIDVVIDSKLILLYKRSLPNFKFIAKNEGFSEDDYDHVFMSASLGKYLRGSILDFAKHPVGYLVSNKNSTNVFRERFSKKGKFVCGISWKSANENIGNDKSFELAKLIPILKMENITFLNLQYGNVAKEIECVVDENSIEIEQVNEIDKYNDIDGLASLIDACDFVISVSNITAHLSGALNKKTFLLLPHSRGRLWYWHNADERSLWYPSITQFPQKREESWDETIFRLLNKIQGYLNEKIG